MVTAAGSLMYESNGNHVVSKYISYRLLDMTASTGLKHIFKENIVFISSKKTTNKGRFV